MILLIMMKNEKWIDQHDMSMGQGKNLSPRQDSNPWPLFFLCPTYVSCWFSSHFITELKIHNLYSLITLNDEKVASSKKHTEFKTRKQKPCIPYLRIDTLFLASCKENPYPLGLHIPIEPMWWSTTRPPSRAASDRHKTIKWLSQVQFSQRALICQGFYNWQNVVYMWPKLIPTIKKGGNGSVNWSAQLPSTTLSVLLKYLSPLLMWF